MDRKFQEKPVRYASFPEERSEREQFFAKLEEMSKKKRIETSPVEGQFMKESTNEKIELKLETLEKYFNEHSSEAYE